MTVLYERRDATAHIILAREASLNAMNRQMYAALNDAFHAFNADADARVAILSSSDERAFCAGVDIRDVHAALTDEGVDLDALGAELSLFFESPGTLEKPVIAAINGHCVGEGMVMTLFCDLRIASEDASFALPEAKIGVPSINGTIRAVQLAGHGPAMELLLTGESRDAAWALDAGFVNAVVTRDQLMATATRMADSIASGGETAIRIMRQLGERALDEKFSDLVDAGLALRASLAVGDTVGRQATFLDRGDEGSGSE